MEDVAPVLLKKIQEQFVKLHNKSNILKKLYKKIEDGKATYKEANEYAIEVGEILAKCFKDNLSSSVLPDGRMYYNIAKRILTPTMQKNYDLITNVTSQIQTLLNKRANIGIKGIVPTLNQDKIIGIINRVSSEHDYDEVAWILDEPIVNFSQSIVDDSIQVNAEFHSKAGMSPKIIRSVAGNCCEWCREREGNYFYPNVPRDIFKRHNRCRCIVEYFSVEGKVQNVHTKMWNSEMKYDRMKKRRIQGIIKEKSDFQEIEQKKIDTKNRLLLLDSIKNKRISLEINLEKQLPHMYETKVSKKSYFEIDIKELQQMLYKYHGTGKIYVKSNNQIKEVITVDKNIGKFVDLDSGKETETNRMTVHYSKKRTHIVPARKEPMDE